MAPKRKAQAQKGSASASSSANAASNKSTSFWSSNYFLLTIAALFVAWVAIFWTLVSDKSFFQTVHLQKSSLVPAQAFDQLRSSAHNELYLWGSYRPHLYFGLRTRQPLGLLFGMMWLRTHRLDDLRHTCEQNQINRYGWIRHDSSKFGEQEIVDQDLHIKTFFVKEPGHAGGDWAVRVTGEASNSGKRNVSLFFYLADETNGQLQISSGEDELPRILSSNGFSFMLNQINATTKQIHTWMAPINQFHNLTAQVKQVLKKSKEYGVFTLPNTQSQHSNFIMWQIVVQAPFEIDLLFHQGDHSPRLNKLQGVELTELLAKKGEEFDERFENVFHLKQKSFNESHIRFARAALSNLVGGIGYFHGTSLVQVLGEKKPQPYGPSSLLTAVPSRSFFPRGFLWDEGFHQLLISRWNPTLSMDILAHWLDLMNKKGWIPREQILGEEALSKVPSEFVVQRPENANPPTLLLPLLVLLNRIKTQNDFVASSFLKHIMPRLELWYSWYMNTQSGPLPNSFTWRGRQSSIDSELNPKTLTSGLDDYPRASHPSQHERHVDLLCWMTLASDILHQIPLKNTDKWRDIHAKLADVDNLNKLHWDEVNHRFADWGNHTEHVTMRQSPQNGRFERSTLKAPTEQFVPQVGYITFFPLMMTLLDPTSEQLGYVLRDIQLIWTDYGLSSLAKTSSLYMKYNTEHDPPYWRGPIWINMNYMILRGLRHYSKQPGQHQQTASDLYTKLRDNLINNIYREYQRTGYLWENYHPETGRGQGCHPFTGWTTLVVLIMAEDFE